jgi:hypothetical protein
MLGLAWDSKSCIDIRWRSSLKWIVIIVEVTHIDGVFLLLDFAISIGSNTDNLVFEASFVIVNVIEV